MCHYLILSHIRFVIFLCNFHQLMKNETGRNDFKVWKMWLNKKQLKSLLLMNPDESLYQ